MKRYTLEELIEFITTVKNEDWDKVHITRRKKFFNALSEYESRTEKRG